MRKIYLDTNVILEHAMQRSNYLQVVDIFHLAELDAIECYTSAATFFTIAFFLRKGKNSKPIFKTYFSLGKCDAFVTFNKKDFIKHQNKQLYCLTRGEFLRIAI